MSDFSTIDFFRDESLISDPYPYFDFLRQQCPLSSESHHGVVMVTGYDEALAIYNDTTCFSSATSVTGPFPGFPVPLEGDDVSETIERYRDQIPFSDQLPTMDPPKHKAHRGLLMRLITPKRLRENEDFMWRRVDSQLDDFLPGGEGEVVRGFAGPFTLYVIADLLGVPEEDHETFREELQGSSRARNALGSMGEETLSHTPLEFLYDRFSHYIDDRRREPRDDLLSEIAQATFPDGSTPEVIDVVRIAANLFSAGQETTVRLIGAAFQLLAEDPELQRTLRERRELIPNYIEECLRFESPVKGDFRLARVTTTVGGVEIPAGTTVMVLNGAANRDPRRFEHPDQFEVERENAREHLAFGRGIHSCPGGPLARSEGRIALERFLDRTSEIRISEAVHGPPGHRRYQYAPTHILRGLTRLQLEFTPAD
jgi:cytochrome P450